MNRPIGIVALGLWTVVMALPAAAQDSAPIPRNGGVVQVEAGRSVAREAPGLPGVGLDGGSAERDLPRGPGGLANGVGAYGVMAPDASGTAGNTLTRIPGAIPDTNDSSGIPLASPGAPVR